MTKHTHGQVHSFVPSNNYLRVISVKTKIIMRAIIFVCYQACLYCNCNSTIMIICHVIICARLSLCLFFLIIYYPMPLPRILCHVMAMQCTFCYHLITTAKPLLRYTLLPPKSIIVAFICTFSVKAQFRGLNLYKEIDGIN